MSDHRQAIVLEQKEPAGAFPYRPPNDAVRDKYQAYFHCSEPLADRWIKNLFDKFIAVVALVIASPILFILYVANLIEGILIPMHRGSLVFSYNAVSKGKVFRKYKIRLIANRYVDPEGARLGDWHAFSKEWSPKCRTYTGSFAKKFYLDELPQLFNILSGDISIVGPRPLACHHYERDLKQGNIFRRLIKGGLLGPSQGLKGSSNFGYSEVEFEYLDNYATLSSFAIFWCDMKTICRGLRVVVQGKGL